jgi:hypothetical protein
VNQNTAFFRRLGSLLLAGGLVVGLSTPAWAGPKDAEAKKLAEAAIYEDYLNLQFDAAVEKLKQAQALCEEGCGQSVQAVVLRDLGVVYFAGKEDKAAALDYFKKAFQADPFVKLDEDLSSDEIKAVFEEARTAVGAPSSADSGGTIDADEATAAPKATGAHTAPAEQAVYTPVPLFMTAPADTDSVKLMYRSPGNPKFRSMGLRRFKDGWAGEVDCESVSKTPGAMEYYFVMYDEMGRETGRVGDEFEAFNIPIKNSISGAGPALPDQSPPGSCKEAVAADCPPGFPGCETFSDEAWAQEEEVDDTADAPSVWVTVGFQQDFLLMPASTGACLSDSEYGCYYGAGYRDPSQPLRDGSGNLFTQQNASGQQVSVNSEAGVADASGTLQGAGTINSGFALATQRVLLGVDYAATPSLLVGLRLGYAFSGGPAQDTLQNKGAAFLPFHVEGRLAYWFTGAHRGALRPYAQLSGGMAQIDSSVNVDIVDTQYISECATKGNKAGSGCLKRTVNAWRKTGTVFASAGFGALIATGKNAGILLEGRGMFLFPVQGISLSGQAGFSIGF